RRRTGRRERDIGTEPHGARPRPGRPTYPALFRSGLLDWNGVLLDVFFRGRAARAAPDVVERLRVLDAVVLAQGTAAGEDELPDVVAVGRALVVARERDFLAAPGQLGPEPRAVIPCRPLGPVRAVGVDDRIDHRAHVHDAVDLRPPGVVILLLDRVR